MGSFTDILVLLYAIFWGFQRRGWGRRSAWDRKRNQSKGVNECTVVGSGGDGQGGFGSLGGPLRAKAKSVVTPRRQARPLREGRTHAGFAITYPSWNCPRRSGGRGPRLSRRRRPFWARRRRLQGNATGGPLH